MLEVLYSYLNHLFILIEGLPSHLTRASLRLSQVIESISLRDNNNSQVRISQYNADRRLIPCQHLYKSSEIDVYISKFHPIPNTQSRPIRVAYIFKH